MRICQVLPELNVGGVETGTVDFAKYLVDHGHRSIVVSNGGRLVDKIEEQGSQHYSIPVHKKSLFSIGPCIKALREVILKEKIDIVHARSRIPALIAFFACRNTNAEFVTTCHGYYSVNFFSGVMGWGKLVIVVSEIIGRHMIETFKVPSHKIRLIPRSVDKDKFQKKHVRKPGQSSFVVSCVGRITPIKGHSYFLQAMAKVVRSMPYVKVWIIGDAPPKKQSYRQELELLVKRLGLTNHVQFLGNRSNIPELLADTDVLVMPSVYPESFGRVVLEAQCAGVPPIATNIGGVVDIIEHNKTGLLVEPKDSDALAQAVLLLLKDPKLCDDMVKAGQEKIEKQYLLEHMCSSTIKVYEEVMESLSILVIKISAIGDVALVTASLRAIRQRYPKAKISCLVGIESAQLLQRCPYLDEIIIYDQRDKKRGIWNFIKLIKKVRSRAFDKVVDFQNNEKTHILSCLSGARETYGYANKKLGWLLNRGIIDDVPSLPPVRHQFRVLEQLDIEYDEDAVALELWPSDNDYVYVKELLQGEWLSEDHKMIGINLAASERWGTKNWPIEYIAELCDKLASENTRLILTGLEKDKALAQQVKLLAKSKIVDFTGKTTVMQLAALISRCRVFLTPDSAPMHIAAAMKVPVLGLFGPTDAARHSPPGKNCMIMQKKVECGPCYSTSCRVETHQCMKDISVDEVYAEIKPFLV